MGLSVIYLNELPVLIKRLRALGHTETEIKQLLGISYKADLNKFIKLPR